MHFKVVFLSGIAAFISAAPATAGSGVYFGGGLGIESPANSKWNVPSLKQVGQYDLKSSNTFTLDAGYKFSTGLRIELQGQYGQFDLSKLTPPSLVAPLKGHISDSTLYLNAKYDFEVFNGWGGTIGAGLGSTWNVAHGSTAAGFSVLNGNDRAFAWQVSAGISHRVLSNVDLQIEYRYQGSGTTTATQSGVGAFKFGSLQSQTVTISAQVYISP